MCLTKLDDTIEENHDDIYFKAFRFDGDKLYGVVQHYEKPYEIGVWLRARVKWLYRIGSRRRKERRIARRNKKKFEYKESEKYYKSGFHVFKTEEGANQYVHGRKLYKISNRRKKRSGSSILVVKKVECFRLLATGYQTARMISSRHSVDKVPCLVFNHMKIIN